MEQEIEHLFRGRRLDDVLWVFHEEAERYCSKLSADQCSKSAIDDTITSVLVQFSPEPLRAQSVRDPVVLSVNRRVRDTFSFNVPSEGMSLPHYQIDFDYLLSGNVRLLQYTPTVTYLSPMPKAFLVEEVDGQKFVRFRFVVPQAGFKIESLTQQKEGFEKRFFEALDHHKRSCEAHAKKLAVSVPDWVSRRHVKLANDIADFAKIGATIKDPSADFLNFKTVNDM